MKSKPQITLDLLLANKGTPVSRVELVTAVGDHPDTANGLLHRALDNRIAELRKKGYYIAAVKGKGYVLEDAANPTDFRKSKLALDFMRQHEGKLLTPEVLGKAVGMDWPDPNVRQIIIRARERLKKEELIDTIMGKGYVYRSKAWETPCL